MLCLVGDSGKIVIFAIFAKFATMFSFLPFLLLRAFLDISLQFAKKMKTEFHDNVWTEDITFYLDMVTFLLKYHPLDQARAP